MEVMLIVMLIIQSFFLAPIQDIDNSAFLFNTKSNQLGIAYDTFVHKKFSIHTCMAWKLCPVNSVQF